jgi:hypothetical protein
MLRVDTDQSENTLRVKLEGRFAGNDAENTRTLAKRPDGVRLVIDLTEVTFVDSLGEQVLSFFGESGAEFIAATSYALDVCDRLQLRLAQGGSNTTPASKTNGGRRSRRVRQPLVQQ